MGDDYRGKSRDVFFTCTLIDNDEESTKEAIHDLDLDITKNEKNPSINHNFGIPRIEPAT